MVEKWSGNECLLKERLLDAAAGTSRGSEGGQVRIFTLRRLMTRAVDDPVCQRATLCEVWPCGSEFGPSHSYERVRALSELSYRMEINYGSKWFDGLMFAPSDSTSRTASMYRIA